MDEEKRLLKVWNGATFPKPKLWKGLSWPVGVERLSEVFSDIPQFDNTKVWFDEHPEDNTTGRPTYIKVPQLVAQQIPYQVFTVWYSLFGEPHWYFHVYPVPSASRRAVRTLLENEAFPYVERWLTAKRPETWYLTAKHLRCIWDCTDDTMKIVKEEK